jgi:hypothetical protein
MDIDFRKNYDAVLKRDDKEFEEKPLPEVHSTSVWLYFGFFLGIASIITGFIIGNSYIAGIIGLICSVIGYIKQRRTFGIVAIVLCIVGIVWCFVNPLPRYDDLWALMQQLKENFIKKLQQ